MKITLKRIALFKSWRLRYYYYGEDAVQVDKATGHATPDLSGIPSEHLWQRLSNILPMTKV